MRDLSIIIPSRNEEFLKNTIDDILKNKRGDTEIIVGLDGQWPTTPLEQHPDLNVVYYNKSIGQRAITNQCVKISKAKYIMKVDAHCAFDEGFDVKMLDAAEKNQDATMVPTMRNLWVFDWVCEDAPKFEKKMNAPHRRYQGPSGNCTTEIGKDKDGNPILCGKPTTKEIVWIQKTNPQSIAYRFDNTMHFMYWNPYGKTKKEDLTETLGLQGSCFMVSRKRYIDLDLCSEDFYSWGQQGVEISAKSWLSGGRVLVNRQTFYSHLFRTNNDFSFPYEIKGREVEKNRQLSRDLFFNDRWPHAVHSFYWLLEKFAPIPGWHDNPEAKELIERIKESGRIFDEKRKK